MSKQRVEVVFDDVSGEVKVSATAVDAVTALWMLRAAEAAFLKPTRDTAGVVLPQGIPRLDLAAAAPARGNR